METGTTNEPKPVLDYQGAFEPRRNTSLEPRREFELIPEYALGAAVVFLLIAVVLPEDIGSGRTIINPFRVLSVLLLHGSLVGYCWIRIGDDPSLKLWARSLYSLSLVPLVVLIWTTYYILNGQRRVGVLSPHNPFLQIVLSIFALAIAISVGKWTWRRLRRRRHRV